MGKHLKLLNSDPEFVSIEVNSISDNRDLLLYELLEKLRSIDFELHYISETNPDLEFVYKLICNGES